MRLAVEPWAGDWYKAMAAAPDPALPLLRDVLRSNWVSAAAEQIRKPRRADFRGPRHPIMVRLPEQLFADLQAVHEESGLSLSDLLAIMAYSFLRRTGVTRS